MRVNSKKFFIAVIVFFLVLVGMGIREYSSSKKAHLKTIQNNLQTAVRSASVMNDENYYEKLFKGEFTPVEIASNIKKMTSLATTHEMERLYSITMDANKTLRYGVTNAFTSTSDTLIQPLDLVEDKDSKLRTLFEKYQSTFYLDSVYGHHTLYFPYTTTSGVHTLIVATTKPISLQKISQTAIFDTVAKTILIFLGALPFLILYRNVLASAAEKLSEEVEHTTDRLNETTAILGNRVEEKTKELISESFEDPLTHLPNRHRLIYDMDRNSYQALIILQLHNFSELSHFFGSAIGDSLLQQFALFLTKMELNTYRLGRDEFVLLIDEKKPIEDFPSFCEDFAQHLSNHTFNALNEKVFFTIRMGIDTDKFLSLSHADEALSYANKTSKLFFIYEGDFKLALQYHHNLTVVASIREAYYDGRLICYYQPIISTQTGQILSYETLARLIDKDANFIPTFDFLSIAKKTALYPQITQEIIRQACEIFKNRKEHFSINICALDISNYRTVRYIEEMIVSTDTAKQIIFEIPESDIYDHYITTSLFITQMKSLGAKISVDNFGSSTSNFEKLIHLDIDYIKIDGSLINKLTYSEKYASAIKAISMFAHVIGAASIAESVETPEIFAHLHELEIDYAQGFYIGKPTSCS